MTVSDRVLRAVRSRVGVEDVWPRSRPRALLEAAAERAASSFAADRRGGLVFPAFLPAFDAAAALARLVSLLAEAACHPPAMVRSPCPAMPVVHQEVADPHGEKGLVMRTLMEQLSEEGADLVLVDGIKVIEDAAGRSSCPTPRTP